MRRGHPGRTTSCCRAPWPRPATTRPSTWRARPRVMHNVVPASHFELARRVSCALAAAYDRGTRPAAGAGACVPGSDPALDEAIRLRDAMNGFLRQHMHEAATLADSVEGACARSSNRRWQEHDRAQGVSRRGGESRAAPRTWPPRAGACARHACQAAREQAGPAGALCQRDPRPLAPGRPRLTRS